MRLLRDRTNKHSHVHEILNIIDLPNYTLIIIPLNDGLSDSYACFISDMGTYSLQTGQIIQHDSHLQRAGTSADTVLLCGLW